MKKAFLIGSGVAPKMILMGAVIGVLVIACGCGRQEKGGKYLTLDLGDGVKMKLLRIMKGVDE